MQSHTPCCPQPQISVLVPALIDCPDLFIFSLWCFVSAITYEIYHVFSNLWIAPLDEKIKTERRICFWAFNFILFKYICYSTRSCHLEHSYGLLLFYHGLYFAIFAYGVVSNRKFPSTISVSQLVHLQSEILRISWCSLQTRLLGITYNWTQMEYD